MKTRAINPLAISPTGKHCYAAILNAQPTLTFNSITILPLSSSSHDGFLDEVATEAVRRIGYQIKIINVPGERSLRNVNSGMVDGELFRFKGIDKLYPNLIPVPEKMLNIEFWVYSRVPLDQSLAWQALANTTVAHVRGWKIPERNLPASAITTKTKNSTQLFQLLEKQRVEAIIAGRWSSNYLIREAIVNGSHLQRHALEIRPGFMHLNKKHKELLLPLARSLANMKADGSYQSLVAKHLTDL
ncbi:MAG: transporter substrate-binding domain-containing protein [Pseudomonadales bacterium]|nr:transporter substrate-binding domain-containing protein [Pseudomonadales bacterium]